MVTRTGHHKPVVLTQPAAAKPKLPEGTLVNLEQKEGIDPFGLFEEGMDPENENGLSVDNDRGTLAVSLGGFGYTDGETDGKNHTEISALEYSATRQRYLVVSTYEGKNGYELLIDVDRQKKTANVFMREFDKKWSGWELAARYGK